MFFLFHFSIYYVILFYGDSMKKFFKNGITYSVLYGIVFYLINSILNKNNIQFMSWIYYLSNSLIILSFIVGIFQLLLKIKNKIKRNVFLVIMPIFSGIVIFIYVYISMLAYSPEYIIVKDNKKMVANVQGFHNTYIDYYDYINLFMKSKNNIDSEYYSDGSRNPFKNDINYINLIK